MWIKVKRAYLFNGQRVEVGSTLEVTDAFGRELIQSDKVEQLSGPVRSGPLTAESATALVPGAGSGELPKPETPAGEPAKADGKKDPAGKEKPNAGK